MEVPANRAAARRASRQDTSYNKVWSFSTLNTLLPPAKPITFVSTCVKLHCLSKIHTYTKSSFSFFFFEQKNHPSGLLISGIDLLQPLVDLLTRHPTLSTFAHSNRITRVPTRHTTSPPRSRVRPIPSNRHKRWSASTSLILRILELLREG